MSLQIGDTVKNPKSKEGCFIAFDDGLDTIIGAKNYKNKYHSDLSRDTRVSIVKIILVEKHYR